MSARTAMWSSSVILTEWKFVHNSVNHVTSLLIWRYVILTVWIMTSHGDRCSQDSIFQWINSLILCLFFSRKPIEVQVISHHMQRYAVWFGGQYVGFNGKVIASVLVWWDPLNSNSFNSSLLLSFVTIPWALPTYNVKCPLLINHPSKFIAKISCTVKTFLSGHLSFKATF